MSDYDEMYKYIGLAIFLIAFVYLISKTVNFKSKLQLKEGFTLPSLPTVSTSTTTDTSSANSQNATDKKSETPALVWGSALNESNKKLKQRVDMFDDILGFDKYRTDYENNIILLDEYFNQQITFYTIFLADICNRNEAGKKDDEIIKITQVLNQYKAFTETLNSTMKFIDKKKSSSTYF